MNKADGLIRLISASFRRYSRDPDVRPVAARNLVLASIALYAEHASPADVALVAAEAVTEVARQDRIQSRAAG